MEGGYCFVLGCCGQCGQPFSFHPRFVPSLNNVPFCKSCVDRANPMRMANGLPPIKYDERAYEPFPESELVVS